MASISVFISYNRIFEIPQFPSALVLSLTVFDTASFSLHLQKFRHYFLLQQA